MQKKTVTVRAGSDNVSDGGQALKSTQIILHENYTGDYDYNIALIKLSRKIKFNRFAKPVKLATTYPQPQTKAVITGWGIEEVKCSELVRFIKFSLFVLYTILFIFVHLNLLLYL